MPVLLWFLASVIREVKTIQGAIAMQYDLPSGRLGYAVPRPETYNANNISLGEKMVLLPAYWLLTCLVFSTNGSYCERLQKTRVASSVYLEEFRQVLQKFLAEWADSNLLVSEVRRTLPLINATAH